MASAESVSLVACSDSDLLVWNKEDAPSLGFTLSLSLSAPHFGGHALACYTRLFGGRQTDVDANTLTL
jgi:hypothetical protein